MNIEQHLKPPVPKPTQDARDLIARLYREIGISAVAAALEISGEPARAKRPTIADLPSVLRGEDKAA